MKTFFMFVFLALAFLQPRQALAGACMPFNPAWQACTRSDDCALAKDVCGAPASYNRRFLGEASASNQCWALLTNCATPEETTGKPTAVCVATKCTVKSEKLIGPAQQ